VGRDRVPAEVHQPVAPLRRGGAADDLAVEALRAAGPAVTAPRLKVHRVPAGRDRPVSTADVHDLLRASGSRPRLTSVYRVLHPFTAGGIVHVFPWQRFRICDPMPHAHLVC
jgi:Fe2+ or Zn2+ uptake regulation protein